MDYLLLLAPTNAVALSIGGKTIDAALTGGNQLIHLPGILRLSLWLLMNSQWIHFAGCVRFMRLCRLH
jgi:hypothetical protein